MRVPFPMLSMAVIKLIYVCGSPLWREQGVISVEDVIGKTDTKVRELAQINVKVL